MTPRLLRVHAINVGSAVGGRFVYKSSLDRRGHSAEGSEEVDAPWTPPQGSPRRLSQSLP